MKQFFIFIFLIACISLRSQSLKGSVWRLSSIDNIETGKSEVIDPTVKLNLMFGDSVYSGMGCHNYKGTYTTDGLKSLKLKNALVTGDQICLGLGNLEKNVLALYQKVTRYRLTDENLFLFTSDDHRFVFKKN